MKAANKYGRNWDKITKYVGTRSIGLVKSHAKKFPNSIERESNLSVANIVGSFETGRIYKEKFLQKKKRKTRISSSFEPESYDSDENFYDKNRLQKRKRIIREPIYQ